MEEMDMALTEHPVPIYLDDRQNQALRMLAKQGNPTLSELVRRGIELLLKQIPVENGPAFHLIGLGRSGVSHIAENHDEYLMPKSVIADTSAWVDILFPDAGMENKPKRSWGNFYPGFRFD